VAQASSLWEIHFLLTLTPISLKSRAGTARQIVGADLCVRPFFYGGAAIPPEKNGGITRRITKWFFFLPV
jgi:hypothetical protein